MATTSGNERCILVSEVTASGTASVSPVGVTNRGVTSQLLDGVYVTVWGMVKQGSIGANSYVITDGADDTGIEIITQVHPRSPRVPLSSFQEQPATAGRGLSGFDREITA